MNRSRDLYRAGQLETALIGFREICAQDPNNAEAWWLLGCAARHLRLFALSDDGFRRAAELLPRQMPMPYRATEDHFRTLIDEAKQVLADPQTTKLPTSKPMTQESLRLLANEAKGLIEGSASARRWGIAVPGRAAAARLNTVILPLPGREAILGGLSPDALWSHSAEQVILYQVNHENAAGSDRDLVHLVVRSLISAEAMLAR